MSLLEDRFVVDNEQLIGLATKAFAAGLVDGHKPPSDWRLPSGKELMNVLLPGTALADEYRKQLRMVYGAGLALGTWRKYHGISSSA